MVAKTGRFQAQRIKINVRAGRRRGGSRRSRSRSRRRQREGKGRGGKVEIFWVRENPPNSSKVKRETSDTGVRGGKGDRWGWRWRWRWRRVRAGWRGAAAGRGARRIYPPGRMAW